MKQLTIYPSDGPVHFEPGNRDNWIGPIEAEGDRLRKHFTDAELAAEYWRTAWLYECDVQDHDGYDGMRQTQTLRRQSFILDRFATHPHALEDS